jgi:hypothetical protein
MTRIALAMVLCLGLALCSGLSLAQEDSLLVADFNAGTKPNNLGGDFGAWDKDPTDFSQGCTESFDPNVKHGNTGFSMKLDYDVESQNPAYNGFWMFLQGLDASPYDTLVMWVKGDKENGFTTVFKVELKNDKKEVGKFYATGINDEWQRIALPLKAFKGINDMTNLTEFVIVFEDRIASNKKGIIYVDDIQFTKEQPQMPTPAGR